MIARELGRRDYNEAVDPALEAARYRGISSLTQGNHFATHVCFMKALGV
jgi:hypothetical protein